MKFYASEIQCNYNILGPGRHKVYEKEKITPELIAEIKKSIINEELGSVSVLDEVDNYLSINLGSGWAAIEITYEIEGIYHYYYYQNERYENMEDFAPVNIDGQSPSPKPITCDDLTIAACIFEEWAITGERYPTTWGHSTSKENKSEEAVSKAPCRYFSLFITGFGKNKSKTLVFLKKYFGDSNFSQTQRRIEQLPLYLISSIEREILVIEEQLLKIEADYEKEEISYATFLFRDRMKSS